MHPDNSQNIRTDDNPGDYVDNYQTSAYGKVSSSEPVLSRLAKNRSMDFAQLVDKYQHRLFNAVLRMVGDYDDAQELTQEAFLRAFKGLRKFRGESGFYTWLFRIGMNLCINHHRRRSRVHFSSLQAANNDEWATGQAQTLVNMITDPQDKTPLEQAQLREDYHRVLEAMGKLEPASRAVVILRDIEQLNYAEIAQVLDVPAGTVKSRLSRARNTLRKMLG